jgi:hypothetical protein
MPDAWARRIERIPFKCNRGRLCPPYGCATRDHLMQG